MSIDQYRNISFSAYIEYDFLAQANLPKMYLEYSTHFMLFFSPHVAFALEAFVHLYAAAKNVLFSIQSNKKSVNLGTLPVFNFYHQTPCEICPIYLSGNMKEFIWKKSGKCEEFVWKCEGFLKKNEKL